MKDDMGELIRALARKLERGEVDRAAFDACVVALIDESVDDESRPDVAAEEAHAVRSHEISFAARRAREL